MSPRGPRTRIAPGIYQDALGYAVVAHAAGQRREHRFPAGTPLKTMRAWQDDTRADLRETATDTAAALLPGTLQAAVAAYLAPLRGKPLRDARNLLRHWLDALPHYLPLEATTPALLRSVVTTWQQSGRAASTINHRRRALAALFDTMAPTLDNPVRKVPRMAPPAPELRAVDIALAAAILAALPDRGARRAGHAAVREGSKTKARLRVMLWTGLPPATLARVRPEDVDLDRRTVYVRPRRKGAGAPGVTLPLLPEGVEAFRQWLRLGAWGTFSTASARKSFRRAIAAYTAQRAALGQPVAIPADLRPYDLRHTFLSWLLEITGDIAAVKEYAQHADMRSTWRYVQRGASTRLVAAVETVARVRGTAVKS